MKGIIIGAGIGGLTTAIALQQKGISSTILEQSPYLREVGAGIGVAPNALNVLERLGLADDVIKRGYMVNSAHIIDQHEKTLQKVDEKLLEGKVDFGTLLIHRGQLQQALCQNVDPTSIKNGMKLKSVSEVENGVRVTTESGKSFEGDFLLCADGIRSVGRTLLFPSIQPRYAGQTSWRIVVDLPEIHNDPFQNVEIWGDGPGLRAGSFRIDQRLTYCYFTAAAEAGGRDNQETIVEDLHSLFSGFPSIIHHILDASSPSEIFRTDLYDLPPLPTWSKGRVALLGDAAHATTPNLGQGGCQAIESAWVFADQVSTTTSLGEAFANYERLRKKRAEQIVKTSRLLGDISNTKGFAKKLVCASMALTPMSLVRRQFASIYSLPY